MLLIVLNIWYREDAQPLATAVMAQARRNARGAEEQVSLPLLLEFQAVFICYTC